MIANENYPAPGTEVGCEYRWPYHHAHPDCWSPPHKGIVLALDDPRAWTGSLAFPRGCNQEECTAHVQGCLDRGLLMKNVPVLWQSSVDPEQFMQWDSKLRPYAEELAVWEATRAAAYDRENKATSDDVKREWSAAETRIGKFVNLDQDTLTSLVGVPKSILTDEVRSILGRK